MHVNFNSYLYSLLVRDLKKEFPYNYVNNKKYFIVKGNRANIILLKEYKNEVKAIIATDTFIIKRKRYFCKRGYKKIIEKIKKDYIIWNN